MTRRVVLALLLVVVAGIRAQDRPPQNDSIRKEDLQADLFFYAGDAMRGRLTNTPENRIATEFLKGRFERLGLTPPAAGSYFQRFNLLTPTLGPDNQLEVHVGDSTTLSWRAGQDFYTERFSGSARVRGPVVFAGFGISSPEHGHEDLPSAQVKDRIVIVLRHEPGERDPKSPFDGLVTSELSVAWRKALAAQQKGAIGILFADDVHNHPGSAHFEAAARATWPENPQERTRPYMLATWIEPLTIPAARVSRALAVSLLRPTGRTLEELSAASEKAGGTTPIPVPGVEVEIVTTVNRRVVPERNVLGALEGSDPRLRDEWVIVCAHLDHEGADEGRIFNGADDNGSGTAGLLEIAEAYALAARDGRRPRRSVLFAAWNAEERGLLGSWAYTEAPTVPLDRIVAVLNMDMIGRSEEVPVGGGGRFPEMEVQTAESNRNALHVLGYSYAPELAARVDRANALFGLEVKRRYDNHRSNLVRRSDQWPFLHRGVPALFFHTGLHPDYHRPEDRPEKIDYPKLETVVRLVHATSWALANEEARPKPTAAVR